MNYLHNRNIAIRRTPGPISAVMLDMFPDLIATEDEVEPEYADLAFSGMTSPTWKEVEILNLLVRYAQPVHVLDIGTGIGWAAAHMAAALPEGGKIDCVDPFTQNGRGLADANDNVRFRLQENLGRAHLLKKCRIVAHESPAILEKTAPEGGWDLVFIDGWGHDDQPLADLQGVMPYVNPQTVIVLTNVYPHTDQEKAGQWLAGLKTDDDVQQWYFTGYTTRNHLAIFLQGVYQKKGANKFPKWWEKFNKEIDQIFKNANE